MMNAQDSQQPTDAFAPEFTLPVEYLVMERAAGGLWSTIGDDRPFISRDFAERSLRMHREEQAEQVRWIENALRNPHTESRDELTRDLDRLRSVEFGLFERETGPLRRA